MDKPKLTIVASNRDRLNVKDCSRSEWFIKSVQWQSYTNFELLIADGGSNNYEEIKSYFEHHDGPIPMRIVQHKIGEAFLRAFLNNLGIRYAKGEYVLCTDVDMIFGKDFFKMVMENVGENTLVESRTMYLKNNVLEKIYSGELDPYNNLDSIKLSRIKKRTSAGGTQCMIANKENKGWQLVGGFDEKGYIGWGSEDWDLLTRCKYAGIKVRWLGESVNDIMLFHQNHPKIDIKKDLMYQEINKKTLRRLEVEKYFKVNNEGWGGVKN